MEKILEVDNLNVSFNTYAGEVKAVRGVSFELSRGETLAFVGESGCGKTVTAKSILRLLNPPFAVIKPESKIICNGKDVLKMSEKELCEFRGDEVGMIFQDPMTSLNPTLTVGKQIMESLMIHKKLDKKAAREEAIHMLKMVNIPSPEKRIDNYPHEMSGGMRQRVMIAIALACNPNVLGTSRRKNSTPLVGRRRICCCRSIIVHLPTGVNIVCLSVKSASRRRLCSVIPIRHPAGSCTRKLRR